MPSARAADSMSGQLAGPAAGGVRRRGRGSRVQAASPMVTASDVAVMNNEKNGLRLPGHGLPAFHSWRISSRYQSDRELPDQELCTINERSS